MPKAPFPHTRVYAKGFGSIPHKREGTALSREQSSLFARLASLLETPPELLDFKKSRVIVTGRGQLTIENHSGLLEYTTACIRVRAARGEVCVEGEHLTLSVMDPGLVEITGRIDTVRLL
ncbi:MAG: hypothetical protein E7463_13440 [Ruminococcaceae bacterium]|nr:hypothetical protein [Oscillospiraceae bacterium]